MWFAARDLVFGKDRYPIPVPPESIARPDEGRLMPDIAEPFENLIRMLMNVLMIEVRAESGFAFNIRVFRDPENFRDCRAEADLAATLVERIRTDEAIHVAYLATTISELRSFTLRRVGGGTIAGTERDRSGLGQDGRLARPRRAAAGGEADARDHRSPADRRARRGGEGALARFDALADPD